MSKPKIGQTVSIHYNIWLSNESFSSDYYYVGEKGQEKDTNFYEWDAVIQMAEQGKKGLV